MEEQNPFLQNYNSLQNKNAFVFCCGSNRFQELGFKGINQFEIPQGIDQSILPNKIQSISSAINHTLILTENGQILGLGSNQQGNLAEDPKQKQYQNQPLPLQLNLQHEVVQIACGKFKSLCLLENGQIFQWGSFYKNEIKYQPTQVIFKDDQIIVQIGCGLNHCLALSEDGKLFSWGGFVLNKNYGQCGQGHLKPVDSPKLIEFFQDKIVSDFKCGGYHSIAILQDDEVYAWGQGKYGQLGNEQDLNQTTPQKIHLPEDVIITQAACGRQHTMLLTNEGHVYGFGLNSKGQLGLGKVKSIFKPQKIQYLIKKYIIAVYCGHNHSILHIEPQYVYVSGQNTCGQLGLGHTKNLYQFQYQNILLQKNIYEIFTGGDHSWFIVDYDDPLFEADPPSSLENFFSEQETKNEYKSLSNSWVEGQQRKQTIDSINRKSISSESRINISQNNLNFQIRSVNKLQKSSLMEQLEQNNQIEFYEDDNSLEIEQIQQNRGQKITFGPSTKDNKQQSNDIQESIKQKKITFGPKHIEAIKKIQKQNQIQEIIKDKKVTFGPTQVQQIKNLREQINDNQNDSEQSQQVNSSKQDVNSKFSENLLEGKQENSFKLSSDNPYNKQDLLSSQQEDHQISDTYQNQNSLEDSLTNMEDSDDEQIQQMEQIDTNFIYKFCFTKLKYNHKILFIFFDKKLIESIESILRRRIRKIKTEDPDFNLVQMITYQEYINQNNRQFNFIDNLNTNEDQGFVLYFYQSSQRHINYIKQNVFSKTNYSLLEQKESSMGLLYQIKDLQQILNDEKLKILSFSFLEIFEALQEHTVFHCFKVCCSKFNDIQTIFQKLDANRSFGQDLNNQQIMLNNSNELNIQRKKLNQEDFKVIWMQKDITIIKKVNLNYNQITKLYLNINGEKICLFSGFNSLEYLDLSNNPLIKTWGSNLIKLSNLKYLKIDNSSIEKDHNLRFLKHLKNLQFLSIKNHRIYNLGLKSFQKITGKMQNLKELDIRQIGNQKVKKLRQKDKNQLLSVYPNLEKFNGEKLDKIRVLKEKPQRDKSQRLSVYGKNFFKDQKRMIRKESQKENRVQNFNYKRKNIFDQDSLSHFSDKKFDSDDSFIITKRGISKSSLDEKYSEKKFVCNFLDDFNKMKMLRQPFQKDDNLKNFFDQNLDQAKRNFFQFNYYINEFKF